MMIPLTAHESNGGLCLQTLNEICLLLLLLLLSKSDITLRVAFNSLLAAPYEPHLQAVFVYYGLFPLLVCITPSGG